MVLEKRLPSAKLTTDVTYSWKIRENCKKKIEKIGIGSTWVLDPRDRRELREHNFKGK